MSEFDAADGRGPGGARRRRPLRRRPGDAPPLRVDDGPQRRRRGRSASTRTPASACARSSGRGGASTPCPTCPTPRPAPAGARATAIATSSATVSRRRLGAACPVRRPVGSWASECVIDPLGVSLSDQGRPARAGDGDDGRARRRPRRGAVPDLGHGQVVRVERGRTASTSACASAGPGSWRRRSATARRSAARTRRPAASTARGAGSSSTRSTSRPTPPGSPTRPGRCCRRRCARAARRR